MLETLCNVKHIVEMGAEAFAKLGTPNNTGTRLVSLSGDVKQPGYFEIETGKVTLGELINDCLLYTSPSPRDATLSRMPSSA